MKLAHRLVLIASVVVCSLQPIYAQDPCTQGTAFRHCPACGKTQRANLKQLNVLKNRGRKATNPQPITVAEMRDAANDNVFTSSRKVSGIAFVASVVFGGNKETCNCKRTDLRDVHINVVADPSEVGNERKYVIVEFTPRWEKRFNFDDSDYPAMVQTVKGQIEGKWVKFEGYMMRDFVHAGESGSTAPNVPTCTQGGPKPCVWRATPWEVHPVTAYTVVTGP